MSVIVTGAAGFIGMHASLALLAQGREVIGVDNLNAYYDPALKRARVGQLSAHKNFRFAALDIADRAAFGALLAECKNARVILHLAAQAGVRYSREAPLDYVSANVAGQVQMLELAARLDAVEHFVYASSSSVYGRNAKVPFSESDDVSLPSSLYAATKRADELISEVYAHQYGIAATGLRFFTVYGPWGRPDMAYFLFTRNILMGAPIDVYDQKVMARDFTFIDDVVQGILAAIERPPSGAQTHRLFNLGRGRAEPLTAFIAAIEQATGKQAQLRHLPMPMGDVVRTFADISLARKELGYHPQTSMEDGIPKFVAWYRDYHRVQA